MNPGEKPVPSTEEPSLQLSPPESTVDSVGCPQGLPSGGLGVGKTTGGPHYSQARDKGRVCCRWGQDGSGGILGGF